MKCQILFYGGAGGGGGGGGGGGVGIRKKNISSLFQILSVICRNFHPSCKALNYNLLSEIQFWAPLVPEPFHLHISLVVGTF